MAPEQVLHGWQRFRHRLIRIELLTELMQVALLAALLVIPVLYFFPENLVWLIGCLVLATPVIWQVRLHARRLWQYLLACLLLIAIPVLLPLDIWLKLILALSLLILAIRSFAIRIRSAEDQPVLSLGIAAAVIGYLLALNLLADRLLLPGVSQGYFYLAICYLLLSVWRWHHLILADRLARFAEMPTQPAGRIRRFNRFLLFGFALLMLLIFLASPWFHLQELLPWLGMQLLAVLRWLMSLFSPRQGEPSETAAPEATQPAVSRPALPAPGETPHWLQVLQAIFEYIFIGLAVLILLAIFIYILYSLYRRFQAGTANENDVLESLLPRLPDQVRARFSRDRGRLARQFGQSFDQRIRRFYYRLVEWQVGHGLKIDPDMTPRQIAARMRQTRFLDIDEMTVIYEKARYGAGLCTAADAQKMRGLYRNIRRRQPGRQDDGTERE